MIASNEAWISELGLNVLDQIIQLFDYISIIFRLYFDYISIIFRLYFDYNYWAL